LYSESSNYISPNDDLIDILSGFVTREYISCAQHEWNTIQSWPNNNGSCLFHAFYVVLFYVVLFYVVLFYVVLFSLLRTV